MSKWFAANSDSDSSSSSSDNEEEQKGFPTQQPQAFLVSIFKLLVLVAGLSHLSACDSQVQIEILGAGDCSQIDTGSLTINHALRTLLVAALA